MNFIYKSAKRFGSVVSWLCGKHFTATIFTAAAISSNNFTKELYKTLNVKVTI